jgi:RNA polymerase sigma factor (sigma-70 family)
MEALAELGNRKQSSEEAEDQALLDRYRESDDNANFEAIYCRFRVYLRTYAQRHLRGQFAADIDDIVNTTFLDLHRSRAELKPNTHLRGFLHRLMENNCNDLLRKGQAKKRDHHLTCPVLDTHPDPRMQVAEHEREMYLNELLGTLPLKQATALRLKLEGHSAASAAKIMGSSEDNVEWWISDGKRRLKEMAAE